MSPENLIPLSEHERFEQLCALLAVGELPEADFQELQRHLAECASCQQLYTDFCRIGSDDLGFAAAHRLAEAAATSAPAIPKEAMPYLERLYDRIAASDQGGPAPVPHVQPAAPRSLWRDPIAFHARPIAAWALAALLVLAIGAIGYRRYEDAATQR